MLSVSKRRPVASERLALCTRSPLLAVRLVWRRACAGRRACVRRTHQAPEPMSDVVGVVCMLNDSTCSRPANAGN
eukprot:6178087-Pleurochrysis_carterae.AAC.1